MRFALWLLSVACLVAAGPVLAQSRFSFSKDGSEVTDKQTGLTWRRCAEGMTWNGSTCSGAANSFTFDNALVHIKSQPGWRMPEVRELEGLVDRTRANPAIDVTAFPGTVSRWHWSSTPYAGNQSTAWVVDFTYGSIYDSFRGFGLALRLVRQTPG